MKAIFKILIFIFIFLSGKICYSLPTDTVESTITNFQITNGATKFSYDIYSYRVTSPQFFMGNSSYVIRFNSGTLNNPVITYANPKYTTGSPTNSYNAMTVTNTLSKVSLQINTINGAVPGDEITHVPGFNGLGEKIATVQLDIVQPVTITLIFNVIDCGIVSPNVSNSATGVWVGFFSGTLPVELSSFSSSINRNDVALNWATSAEVNNSGFEIERKSVSDNSGWDKIGFVNGNGNSHNDNYYRFDDRGLKTGKFNYRLKQIDYNGNYEYFDLSNEIIIGVPAKFELSQNYPNPFNPATKINFSLPLDTKISLNIYDISGRLISTLIKNEFRTANYYTVEFNGFNLASGTYFYTIQTDRNNETKKMILLK